jgi:hypothetical protein
MWTWRLADVPTFNVTFPSSVALAPLFVFDPNSVRCWAIRNVSTGVESIYPVLGSRAVTFIQHIVPRGIRSTIKVSFAGVWL